MAASEDVNFVQNKNSNTAFWRSKKKTVMNPEETLGYAISKIVKIIQTYESRYWLEPKVDKFIPFQELAEHSQYQATNRRQQLYNSRHSSLFRLDEIAKFYDSSSPSFRSHC